MEFSVGIELLLFVAERIVGGKWDPNNDRAEHKLDSDVDQLASNLVVTFFSKFEGAAASNWGHNENADHVEPPADLNVPVALVIVNIGDGVSNKFVSFASGNSFSFASKIPLESLSGPESVGSRHLSLLVDIEGAEGKVAQIVEHTRVPLNIEFTDGHA